MNFIKQDDYKCSLESRNDFKFFFSKTAITLVFGSDLFANMLESRIYWECFPLHRRTAAAFFLLEDETSPLWHSI